MSPSVSDMEPKYSVRLSIVSWVEAITAMAAISLDSTTAFSSSVTLLDILLSSSTALYISPCNSNISSSLAWSSSIVRSAIFCEAVLMSFFSAFTAFTSAWASVSASA